MSWWHFLLIFTLNSHSLTNVTDVCAKWDLNQGKETKMGVQLPKERSRWQMAQDRSLDTQPGPGWPACLPCKHINFTGPGNLLHALNDIDRISVRNLEISLVFFPTGTPMSNWIIMVRRLGFVWFPARWSTKIWHHCLDRKETPNLINLIRIWTPL